ncbi:MAG: hypothetical protein LBB51_00470, partial [Zoogloeaceae bacterium]|nr:hypothetical protein [Zoogloeaceae bacterium]
LSGLAENFSTRLMAERLAELPALQGEHAGFITDFLLMVLASKPLGRVFHSVRVAFKGLLALLVLGSAGWLGLRLGGHAELARDVARLAVWGAGLLLAWCVAAVCILGVAMHRCRRKTAG